MRNWPFGLRGEQPVAEKLADRKDEGEAENVVSHRGEQPSCNADQDCRPKLPVSALTIENSEGE